MSYTNNLDPLNRSKTNINRYDVAIALKPGIKVPTEVQEATGYGWRTVVWKKNATIFTAKNIGWKDVKAKKVSEWLHTLPEEDYFFLLLHKTEGPDYNRMMGTWTDNPWKLGYNVQYDYDIDETW